MGIRVVDAGTVSDLRSQALYHGLARACTPDSPDTIVLAIPGSPYVCIGFHQDPEQELDLEFCRAAGLPVIRREAGGGAVYLDSDQLFVQWVMRPSSLPARIGPRFELFIRPLVETYRALGLQAVFRPPNDVQIDGRKIAGTGAARIGDAEVLIGNFIFDFDCGSMTSVLRAPSSAFRSQVRDALDLYMTSIRAETERRGVAGDVGPEQVKRLYLDNCAQALGEALEAGQPTEAETGAIEAAERRLASPEFFSRPGGLLRHGVKIHADVSVVECDRREPGGTVRATARIRGGRIEDLRLSGRPCDRGLSELAHALRGVELRPGELAAAIDGHHRRSAGAFDRETWTRTILGLHERRGPSGPVASAEAISDPARREARS